MPSVNSLYILHLS